MKLLKNLFFAFIILFLLPQITMAQYHQKSKTGNHKSQQMEQYNASQDFQNQLKEVFAAYINLKEALVSSDTDQAVTNAIKMADQLKIMDNSILNNNADKEWMKSSGTIQKGLSKI